MNSGKRIIRNPLRNRDDLSFHEYISENNRVVSNFFETFDSMASFPLSWLSPKTNFFIDTLNKLLMESEQHGITQHFIDSQFINIEPKLLREISEPQVLTMQMLSAGFIIWFASVVVACIVFVIEHIIAYSTRKFKMKLINETKNQHKQAW
jgi:hypothetical protein